MEPILASNNANLVKDIDTQGFISEVLKGSNDTPVLVDFWAPWCGPCKQLGPVLEKIVNSYKGKVRLVKLDIDQNPQVATQMGVQSIPAVFAFYKGQPVDGFMGAQPESAIRGFIDKLLKISGGQLPGTEQILARAEEALESGNIEAANDLYAALYDEDPTCASAYAGLVKVALAAKQVEEAKAMLAEAPKEIASNKELVSLRAKLDLMDQTASLDTEALDNFSAKLDLKPDEHQTRYDYALALYATGNDTGMNAAIDQLVELTRRNREWNDEAARKQLLKIFDALGVMHPLTIAGRRKLSAVLFS